MFKQWMQFQAMARLTAREVVRSSALLLVSAGCLLLHALLPMTVSHTLGESGRMMADTSMALHLLSGLIVGSFAACQALSGEMRGGTAASILSKPVSPSLFYLAKFAGVAVPLLAFSALATAAGLLGVRAAAEPYTFDPWAALPLLAAPLIAFSMAGVVNYVTRRPFHSVAFGLLLVCTGAAFLFGAWVDASGHACRFGALYSWPLVTAHLLVAQAVLLLAAVALALAVRLQAIATVTLCGLLFLAGLMSDAGLGRHAAANRMVAGLYRLLPNWNLFWVMESLHEDRAISIRYVADVSIYAALLLLAFLGFGLVLFRHAEVKS
jgi:hypothetical protein